VPILKAFALERLPDYMVPSAFVCLERLPLSPNGKIDRRALPAPDPPVSDASPAAPRDEVEERLVTLWAELLGLRTVGLRDNFFDIGGHSLLAAKLIAQINKSFSTRIPLAALFESNTVEQLAALVRGDHVHEADRSLVFLSKEGTAPPLIFVHPLGGSVDEYLPLARRLAPDQPFIGVHAPIEGGVPDWANSIERMAARYVDELCRSYPRGPVFIGGWSGGATVALEMAQQLKARGRDVPLVIALDASPFNTGTGTSRWSPAFAWKLLRNLPHWIHDDIIVSGGADLPGRIRRKLGALMRKTAARGQGEQAFTEDVEGFFDLSRLPSDYRMFMKRYYLALRTYVPKPYSGRVLLFKARTQPLYHLIEPELAWPVITKELEVKVLPCTHLSIVEEPHVQALAKDMKARIAALAGQLAERQRASA
jgi:thioesterase domain-containing protein/acyl carrier protein